MNTENIETTTEKPQFKVSYDLESEYTYNGVTYRIRYGAHRLNSAKDYFPEKVKLIGTVTHDANADRTKSFHVFPDPEVVDIFSKMFEVPLVGARWTDTFSDLEYQGQRGDLWEDEYSVYLKAYIQRFRNVT